MSRAKKVLLAALAAATCLSLSAAIACTNGQTQTDADIINGGFETQSDEWVG